mmetsp:Transcript_10528/g.36737  ORF Transcript_10528/g.36737 Transcript_10528/m.36737 type:complete len:208 (+) Transcript_10528:3875-4498(+)
MTTTASSAREGHEPVGVDRRQRAVAQPRRQPLHGLRRRREAERAQHRENVGRCALHVLQHREHVIRSVPYFQLGIAQQRRQGAHQRHDVVVERAESAVGQQRERDHRQRGLADVPLAVRRARQERRQHRRGAHHVHEARQRLHGGLANHHLVVAELAYERGQDEVEVRAHRAAAALCNDLQHLQTRVRHLVDGVADDSRDEAQQRAE